ncbi:MAG: MBL fold metallo-hydrolase [Acidimicrobiia bacterium]|nr:MBL fold metallo-hydrolase [Acidimicrobiia bacterium]
MFDELGDGIYRRRYESLDLNIGVVIGDDGVLLIDSRASHRQADELRDELRTLTDLPVGWVVNTHFHWDHTWGNARFPEATIWGHDRCRSEMIENGEVARQGVLEWMPAEYHEMVEEVEITPPTHTFAETASLHIGRSVELGYHGLGHTNSDIAIRVGSVMFAGDLLEEGAPPSFGDSYPLDWGRTLTTLPNAELIVPGHGDVVGARFRQTQTQEIQAVAELAKDGHRGGKPFAELINDGPYPGPTMEAALGRAYAQLDGDL